MNQTLAELSTEDHRILAAAMLLAADSPLFPDRNFRTLFGVEREELRYTANNWPHVDLTSQNVHCAVLNSLNHLVGYPHGQEDTVREILGVDGSALIALYRRIAPMLGRRGDGEGYASFLV